MASDGHAVMREGNYYRYFPGGDTEVMLTAQVFDGAVESGMYAPSARYSLFLKATRLVRVDGGKAGDGYDEPPKIAEELESIEITGTPFEARFAKSRPESERWPVLEAPFPTLTYTLHGDFLDVPKLNEDQRRLAATALIQAFVIKYGVYELTADKREQPDESNEAEDQALASDNQYDWPGIDDTDMEPEPLLEIEEEEALLARFPDVAAQTCN